MKEILIGQTPDYQKYIRQYAEKNKEWPYAPIVAKWYPRVETLKQRFFDGVLKPWDLTKLPSPPIAVEDMRNYRTLAAYRLVPDGYGLNDKLTINAQHFKEDLSWDYGGDWGLAETITHEAAHLWHKHKGQTKPSHNAEFTDKLQNLGIYCNSRGAHYKIADSDSPFGILMRQWGIERPEEVTADLPPLMDWFKWLVDAKPRGRSTLTKWSCPDCKFNVRVGIKGDPELYHKHGEEDIKFVSGDIYRAKK